MGDKQGDTFIEYIEQVIAESTHKSVDDPALTPAGVMLLVYRKDNEYCILLQKRSSRVDSHKGEISFPGGKRDPNDESMLATAIRETHEEMGIDPQDVRVFGALDQTSTTTGYLTYPFVGTIPYPYNFYPSEQEVAEVLEVPVSSLMDTANRRGEMRVVNGDLQCAPVFAYDGHIIFGATARILDRFIEMLQSSTREAMP